MSSSLSKSIILVFLFFVSLLSIKGESIEFSADSMRYEAAEGKEFTLLSGNAYVKTDSKEIRADEIRLYGDDYNILLCEGNVSVEDSEEEMKITSSSLYYDRSKKITRINGRSEVLDYKNEMIIKSGFLEYRQNEDIILMQIGVRILKEDLTCRCEFATYNKEADSLVMTGIPVVYKNEDVFRASQITVLLENDEIQMDGKVEGSLIIKEEESGNDPES